MFQDGMRALEDIGDPPIALDFEGMDFNVNDMLWLNYSTADILF